MIQVIWEFHVKSSCVTDFMTQYSEDGAWSRLFRSSPSYRGTRLLRDPNNPERFVTIDTWDNIAAYESFKVSSADIYRTLDKSFEEFTESENCLGIYEVVSGES